MTTDPTFPLDTLAQAVCRLLGAPGERVWPELGLKLLWTTVPEVPGSVLQQPACLFVLRGGKVLLHRQRRWRAGAGDTLMVNLPMLVVCDTAEVNDAPLVAIGLDLDMGTLVDLHTQGCPYPPPGRRPVRIEDGLHLSATDAGVLAALHRLVGALDDGLALRVLGAAMVRELHFWLLRSAQGLPLHRLMEDRNRLATVVRAVQHLRRHPEQTPAMEALARELAMSPSAFYAVFAQVMGTSPLQYLKGMRLNRAHQLLRQGGLRVNQVAEQVGYTSTSQFSREFQRMFGVSPSTAALERQGSRQAAERR
jgi:AraC-like DNA-binding protein